jgi:hypothetical protein
VCASLPRFTGTKIYLLTSTTVQILTPEELQLLLQQGQVCVSTPLTCFTSTKVHTLTPEELGARQVSTEASPLQRGR